eukprot:2762247-Pleurochrysis_carterae.AAC.1
MEFVEGSQCGLVHALDFKCAHEGFDGGCHSARGGIGFGKQETDQFTATSVATRPVWDSSGCAIDSAQNRFH